MGWSSLRHIHRTTEPQFRRVSSHSHSIEHLQFTMLHNKSLTHLLNLAPKAADDLKLNLFLTVDYVIVSWNGRHHKEETVSTQVWISWQSSTCHDQRCKVWNIYYPKGNVVHNHPVVQFVHFIFEWDGWNIKKINNDWCASTTVCILPCHLPYNHMWMREVYVWLCNSISIEWLVLGLLYGLFSLFGKTMFRSLERLVVFGVKITA